MRPGIGSAQGAQSVFETWVAPKSAHYFLERYEFNRIGLGVLLLEHPSQVSERMGHPALTFECHKIPMLNTLAFFQPSVGRRGSRRGSEAEDHHAGQG